MMEWLWTHERPAYSARQRFLVMIPLAVIFLRILPAGLIGLSAVLDRALRLPRITLQPLNRILGGLLMGTGWLLAMWTIVIQFTAGRGTPVPAMPTQKLIVDGPYRYCRNPMVLGTIGMYMGLAVGVGSLSAAALVLIPIFWLLVIIKRWEEPELEARFGEAYRVYRQHTPFLLPRLGGQKT